MVTVIVGLAVGLGMEEVVVSMLSGVVESFMGVDIVSN